MSRRRACDVCYRRKIQCLIPTQDDPCDWCGEHDLACTFTREVQRRKTRLKLSDVEGLFSRVEQLENALATSHSKNLPSPVELEETEGLRSPDSGGEDDLLQSETTSSAATIPFLLSGSSVASQVAGVRLASLSIGEDAATCLPLAQYWYCRGLSLLSERGRRYIFSKTGQDRDFRSLGVVHPRPSLLGLNCLQFPVDQRLWELPPEHQVRKLAATFFSSPFQLIFPIIDRALFNITIEVAYGRAEGLTPSNAASKACVLAAFSMFRRLDGSREFAPDAKDDICAAKAQCILAYMPGEISLTSLEAVLMLVSEANPMINSASPMNARNVDRELQQRHHTTISQGDNVAPLHAVACRMVCALGGHVYQALEPYRCDISLAGRQAHHLRTLFWLCYHADKDISLRSGQIPLLTEEYCDLTIAEDCTSYCAHLQEFDPNLAYNDSRHSHVPGDPGLCRIKEKVYNLLFSPQAFSLSDGVLISRIRQLDDDLERWRLSIPIHVRPKLSISSSEATSSAGTRSLLPRVEYLYLQLEYHYMVIAIHGAIRRCGAENPESEALPEDLHSVIHSSCDLYLEASRSTLTLLKRSISVLVGEDFSRKILNLNAAVVTLFIDIIAHPHGIQPHTATEHLISAIDIIQNLVDAGMTERDSALAHGTIKFIRELIDLGRMAIARATGSGNK
ncbi:hypothetical protein F5Y14DRAFT_314718 [Nemania sp. NC0429]|nr:hypothetical protein F5Y14DRAFT_314718 [Nemania sp. NC0429]